MNEISEWILKTAEEAEKSVVDLSDPKYKELCEKYEKDQLTAKEAGAFEEIEYLRDLVNVVATKILNGLCTDKEAAKPPSPEPSKKEVPPPMASGKEMAQKPKVLPAMPGNTEPQVTRWKEVRFNKKDGKWQTVLSERTVNNFNTEDEALEFLGKT